jgi:hypothetical protein
MNYLDWQAIEFWILNCLPQSMQNSKSSVNKPKLPCSLAESIAWPRLWK